MTREIDPNTRLDTTYKQPSESRTFSFDFSALIGDETILSLGSIEFVNMGRLSGSSDIVLSNKTHNGNSLAQVRAAEGQDGENYKITAIVNTSGGDILEGEGLLKVRDF